MKLPAIFSRVRGALAPKAKALSAVESGGGWFRVIGESFAGAFQSHVTVDAPRDVLAFSAVYSCVTLIASDIAKLGICLEVETGGDISVPAPASSPYWQVLRKPNHFQNRIKFVEQWIVSKLLYGNTYALKVRDARGIVTALYILDAQRVTPLVADDGSVYYRLAADHLSGLQASVTMPSSEIIHDTMVSLFHPLVGVSPIYACGVSATMGNRIQTNSTAFFGNASRPVGILVAPGAITKEQADIYKLSWEESYGGQNRGRTAVLGNGLKYEQLTIPAGDAQLIEQLKWTVEDVARCFHMPLFKIGAASSAAGVLSVEAQQQLYLNDCLQVLIESLELCLTDGLSMPAGYEVEIDEEDMLRMDTAAQITSLGEAVKGGWFAPNEARAKRNLPPVAGGASPYLQQQNYSLAALAKRDALADPFGKAAPAASDTPALPNPAVEAANEAAAAEEAAALLDYIAKGLACETT